MCAHTSLGTQPIYLFGDDEQKARLLPDLCAGRKLGAFGLTEPEAGSDAGNVKTRASLDADDWVIDGAKQFITNAGTDISGHVDDHRAHGRRRDLQPHRRERHARLRAGRAVPQDGLERVGHAAAELRRLPCARGEPARPARRRASSQFLQILDIGRIGVAAMGVGLAQGALDEALTYAKERQAFGQADLASSRRSRRKLADMATEIEAARLLDVQGGAC